MKHSMPKRRKLSFSIILPIWLDYQQNIDDKMTWNNRSCVSICLSIYPSIYLSIYLSIDSLIYLSTYLPTYLYYIYIYVCSLKTHWLTAECMLQLKNIIHIIYLYILYIYIIYVYICIYIIYAYMRYTCNSGSVGFRETKLYILYLRHWFYWFLIFKINLKPTVYIN